MRPVFLVSSSHLREDVHNKSGVSARISDEDATRKSLAGNLGFLVIANSGPLLLGLADFFEDPAF